MDDKIDIRKLKSEIEIFFNKKFRNCLKIMNKNNDENWFYVQASKKLPTSIHYEYLDEKVHLHIETDNKEFNYYIKSYLESKTRAKFDKYKHSCYSYTLDKDINSVEELKSAFIEIKNKFNKYFNKLFKNVTYVYSPVITQYIDKSKNISNPQIGNIIVFISTIILIITLFLVPIIILLLNKTSLEKNDFLLYNIILTFVSLIVLSVLAIKLILTHKSFIKLSKIEILKKIINNQEIYNINDTITNYDDKQNIKFITSSDQQAKVLIAAIEAIKDL